jgi:hypothetical protein
MTANDTASPDIKVSIRGGPIRWLIVGGVLLIAAIMIGTTIMAGNFRERALNIAEPDGSSWIVRAVVNIAAERRMTTTAEGVETQQQQQLLRALGCSEMQGHLFSPAKPAAEIRQLFLSDRQRSTAAELRRERKRRQLPGAARV